MAEDSTPTDAADLLAGDDDAGPNKPTRTWMFVAGGALSVLVAFGGAYALGALDGVLAGLFGPSVAEGDDVEAAAGETAPTIVFYELPDMVVSLNTNERKSTFLKVRVTLELTEAAAVATIERLLPRIVDQCQVYLRELRPDDLRGSAGTLRLREELRRRIAAAVAPTAIRDVLFVDLLVQ